MNAEQIRKTYENAGIYLVALVAEDYRGCRDTVTKAIEIYPDFHIYVPNAFTPNTDYINDYFTPVARGILSFNLEIFSRWGELLFEMKEGDRGWDGTYRGALLPNDAYVWKLRAMRVDGKPIEMTGSLSLIR